MGVMKTIYAAGSGPLVKAGQRVTIAYTGWFKDMAQPGQKGEKFDSSVDRGDDFVTRIGVGQVIKGWDEGVVQMKVGEKARLDITSDYAYGNRRVGPIPPGSDLIFDVEVKKAD